ncbi:hypothetical protein D3C81_966640 [compost metagenome]
MLLRIGQRERRTPGAAKYQPALHAGKFAQPLDIVDHVPRGVVLEPGMRRRSSAAALVEQQHVIARRVEQPPMVGRDPATGPAMQEHCRLGARRADALVVQDVAVADIERAGVVGLDFGVEGAQGGHGVWLRWSRGHSVRRRVGGSRQPATDEPSGQIRERRRKKNRHPKVPFFLPGKSRLPARPRFSLPASAAKRSPASTAGRTSHTSAASRAYRRYPAYAWSAGRSGPAA